MKGFTSPKLAWSNVCGVCVCVCVCMSVLNHVQLFVNPWTVACQASLSMGFPRQEYQSGQPFPSPGDLPDPGIKPVSLESCPLAGGLFTTVLPGKLGLISTK